MPAQANISVQADVLAQADVPPWADELARGDYEVGAKCTRSASARGSTRPTKKPRCYHTTVLDAKLPTSQLELETPIVAVDASVSVTAG